MINLRKVSLLSRHLYNRVTYLFLALALISCFCTYFFFYDIHLFNENPKKVVSILYFDIVSILIFMFLVSNKISFVWSNRHKKGSRLTLKLISIFSFISILPSILMCIFSSIFFHNGMESWFDERNQTVLKDSIKVARSYLEENQRMALNDSIAISRVVEGHLERKVNKEEISEAGRSLSFLLDDLCNLKGINSAILVSFDNTIVAHTKYSVGLHFLNIKDSDLLKLRELSEQQRNGMTLESDNPNVILSASCFRISTDALWEGGYAYLITEKNVNPEILNNANNAQRAYDEYQRLLNNRSSLEVAFILMFFIVGLLILTISIVLAVFYSWEIIKPVSNLVDVSESIIGGNLSARADEPPSNNEISDLTKTFNQMIAQVHRQQNDLIAVNKELDEKVKFISSVLSGVSSGVIGLDNVSLYTWNRKSEELLGKDFVFGENIFNIFPEIQELMDKIDHTDPFISGEITYLRQGEPLLLSVKIVSIVSDAYNRYVITFDDLTSMVVAQHKAAWSEVARRVAHEIKNPLTPIQLSAERIKRKYVSQITTEKDTFLNLIDTIVRQVGDIKRLIDEFNFFARLPEPKFQKCDLEDVCHQVVFLMKNASNDIEIHFSKNGGSCFVNGDDRLLHQCMVNIIKNAVNALATTARKDKTVWVTLHSENDGIHIDIEDNGPGLPKDQIDSLTVPYFSLLPKGTGLGLSIVKKIVQDHKGSLNFSESLPKGAKVTMIIPAFAE